MPSVSRDSQFFSSEGNYWRGGAWPPFWWLLISSETENKPLQTEFTDQVIAIMSDVFNTQGSVFEYYRPEKIDGHFAPGFWKNDDHNIKSEDDFMGWGKLLLKLLIEKK